MSALTFRNLLEAGDVDGCRAFFAANASHLPQAETREQAEIVMHRARTETESVTLRARAYSHRWLCERDLPSGLPDALKPAADRLYPERKVSVGISVNFRSPFMKGAETLVRGAMENAVLDADAHGRIEDAVFVTARMKEAKDGAMRALFGRFGGSI
jgi:hypothetical protein